MEAAKVFLHIQICKSVRSNTHGGNANRKSVDYALNKGMEYVQKYAKYLTSSNHLAMISSLVEDLSSDDEQEREWPEDDLDKKPEDPEKPEKPDDPEDEEKPEKPEKPEDPEDEERPEKPEDPEKPDDGEKPEKPDDPEDEEKPEKPEEPEKPEDEEKPGDEEKPDLQPGDLDEEEDEEKPDEDDLPDEKEEEENLSMLEKIRKQLNELRDRLRKQRKNLRVKVVEAYIRVVDNLIEKLKKHELDNNRFHDFIKRVKEMLEKYADKNKEDEKTLAIFAAMINDLPDNELEDTFDPSDLPDERQEEENLTILEQFKKRLSELRERLRANGRRLRVRVVEAYLRVVDGLIERLKKHQLENGRFNDFVKRVRELLEKYDH